MILIESSRDGVAQTSGKTKNEDVQINIASYAAVKKEIRNKTDLLSHLSTTYLKILDKVITIGVNDEVISNEMKNLREMLKDMPKVFEDVGLKSVSVIDEFIARVKEADESFKL